MKARLALIGASFIVFLVGCHDRNPVKETPEAQFALQIKRRIRDVEEALKSRNAQAAQRRVADMSEDLDTFEQRSGPEHKSIYSDIQKIQRDLAKQSASGGGFADKVRQMKTLADKLPGS